MILGAGAAGMTAGISALRTAPGLRVLLLEKKTEAGRKILASGNGRCNLSNEAMPGYAATLRFFQSLGVLTREEEGGRFYPMSGDARDVRDALTAELSRLGAEIVTDAEVQAVRTAEKGFIVQSRVGAGKRKKVREDQARAVVLACGGKAGPAFGTTGDGARLARMLGHSVTRLAPALTAVETKEDVASLRGVRQRARLLLTEAGREKAVSEGEVQFTEYGLSGICVFDLSRYMEIPAGKDLKNGFDGYEIQMDLWPEMKEEAVLAHLKGRAEAGEEGAALLRSLVRAPLAAWILAEAQAGSGGDPGRELAETARLVKHLSFHPKGLKGWDHAQVTRGGVLLDEVDQETQASLIQPGLYLAGEVLDWDGPCGGFNLEHAWETGRRAGWAAAKALAESR